MTTADATAHLAPDEVLRRLRASAIGRVAFCVDDQPYALPVNCAADADGRVVFRSGDHGLLGRLDGRRVAVEADGYDVTTRTGWSVLVLGRVRDITDATDERDRRLFRLAVVPWAPGPRDRWFVVEPNSMTGRQVTDPNGAVAGWFAGVPAS